MNRRTMRWLPIAATAALGASLCCFHADEATAHVKWFCAYDVAGQPRGLANVLCLDFEWLVGLAVLVIMAGCHLEGTTVGNALVRAINRVTSRLETDTETLTRAVCGFFFVALWTMGGILLTPELKTTSEAVRGCSSSSPQV